MKGKEEARGGEGGTTGQEFPGDFVYRLFIGQVSEGGIDGNGNLFVFCLRAQRRTGTRAHCTYQVRVV